MKMMRFACLLAATPVSAFVSPQRKGAVQLWATNSGNSDDGGPVNVFDMVDEYWHRIRRDKKQNGNDVSNLFGGVLPDAKLPSMPNLIDGFLKKQKGISPSKIEGVEDFDLDLANEIEAALAMAENDIAGGSVNDFDSREQHQQQQQHQQPTPLNQEYFTRTGQQVETATAAATKAWLDNMTSNDTTTLKQEQCGYPQEEVREQNQRPFFANDAVQYTEAATNSNTNDYVGDSPFHRKSEENWSTNDGNSKDQFSAAAQTLADQSIRAGLEKKSVEETYKMYKQYFEQGVQTTFDDGMNSVEASPPLENNDGDDTKVLISDAAFDLAESLRLDPYEIYQHKQNNFDGSNNMIDERDVLNYLDLRYEALLSNNNLPKPRKESRQRKAQVDNSVYEERDKARRQRTRANKSADYGRPRNDSEAEDNWQSYYDSYKQMAEVPIVGGSSAPDRQKHTQKRPQMPPIQRQTEQRHIPEHMTSRSYRPQQPRESHLSKLVFETKTEKLNGPPVNPRQSRMQTQREPRLSYKQMDQVRNSGPRHSRIQPKEDPMPYYEQVMNQAQHSPPNGYVNNRRDQNAHSKPSRGLGTNKNYPQDRSYRETRHKNSIDMNTSGYEDDMSYEEYNAYFAHNRGPPSMPTQSGSNLKGLLENRINQNLHKQELYDLEQQRYLDERLQRDMDRVSRLTQVQDQQRELENRFRHRELQHHQQELDDRLEQNMQRLSETTQKVTRDAKRAIENAQKGWFADGNQN